MKKQNKGFTLIELLVVIAIIGILASVVLVSLGSARQKGQDAKIQEQVSSIRAAAEIYAGNNNSNYNICSAGSGDTTGVYTLTQSATYNNATVTCNSDANSWAVSVPLASGSGNWCADSTGASRKIASALGSGVKACPAN
ncbi:MAG: type II secretion system GspH family protein [Patescibacteria group bacterium]|nr:type II secretion system GspH family protein [Patescibacteria group bacterium]